MSALVDPTTGEVVTLRTEPDRDEILAALTEPDRTRLLAIEQELRGDAAVKREVAS